MNTTKRPIAVWIVACLYIAVGAIGLAAHFDAHALATLQPDTLSIELTEMLAIIIGVFMLCGHNWARWLALLWMAFHVAISFPALSRVAIHSIFFALIAWALFLPATRQYFKQPKSTSQ